MAKKGKKQGNVLFERQLADNFDGGIGHPFGDVADVPVATSRSATAISKDRVGSHTNAPVEILSQSESYPIAGPVGIQTDGTLMTKEPSNVSPGPNSVPWFRRERSQVEPNESMAIITVDVPPGQVYRISHIGHDFNDNNDTFWIMYDGKMFNMSRWSFQLGSPNNLYRLPVTISATSEIVCYGANTAGAPRIYEFFIDGWYDMIQFYRGSHTA